MVRSSNGATGARRSPLDTTSSGRSQWKMLLQSTNPLFQLGIKDPDELGIRKVLSSQVRAMTRTVTSRESPMRMTNPDSQRP
jgi:hypothetical protein